MSEHKIDKAKDDGSIVTSEELVPTRKRRLWLLIIIVLVIGLVAGAVGYYLHQHADQSPDARQRKILVAQADSTIQTSQTPQEKSDAYLQKANIYIGNSDYKSALSEYKLALKLTPDSIVVNSALCNTYYYLKDKQNTETYCQKAIDLVHKDPSSPYASNISLWQSLIQNAQKGTFNVQTEKQ